MCNNLELLLALRHCWQWRVVMYFSMSISLSRPYQSMGLEITKNTFCGLELYPVGIVSQKGLEHPRLLRPSTLQTAIVVFWYPGVCATFYPTGLISCNFLQKIILDEAGVPWKMWQKKSLQIRYNYEATHSTQLNVIFGKVQKLQLSDDIYNQNISKYWKSIESTERYDTHLKF